MKGNRKSRKIRIKRLLAYVILFSVACGPSPIDYREYFSIFYPEAATSPVATEPYYYTNDFLNYQFFMNGSSYLADSINLESWLAFTDHKIPIDSFRTGLYDISSGLSLANQLVKINKKDAAEYVILAQSIDKETQKFGSYWEPFVPVNEQLLLDFRNILIIKNNAVDSDFLKERYLFQLLKIDAKINAPNLALQDYNELKNQFQNKTFISEWIHSRYAGALLAKGDTARAIIEFALVFEKSDSRRNQADLSVRRLPDHFFKQAILTSKNESEKLATLALMAIQPRKDALGILKEIAAIDPNYPMLELAMAREINKNEVNFYIDKNSGLYAHNLDVFDENYYLDPNKVDKLRMAGKSYLEKLLRFNVSLLNEGNITNTSFWNGTAAYLNYLSGNSNEFKKYLKKAKNQSTENPFLAKQINLLESIQFMEENSLGHSENEILDKIAQFKKVENFRDNNVLLLLSEKLSILYLQNKREPKKNLGWLSSCFVDSKRPINSPAVKAFLAQNIPASKEDYGFMNGQSKSFLLKDADIDLLADVLNFIQFENLSEEDKKLIQLSEISEEQLLLAYGRKLIRIQEYEKALAIFNQNNREAFNKGPFTHYFSAYPRQFVGTIDQDLLKLGPLAYLEQVVEYQKKTVSNPNDTMAWFNLGLAAYNLSYWGNAWLFSDREWSSVEIEYGDPTSEDYFTNMYAKQCFETALSSNPDADLGAKISYMGALCERNQYHIAFIQGRPETYDKVALNYYNQKMTKAVKPTFLSFFNRLRNQYNDTQFEKMLIKECITYQKFKTRY